MQLWRNLERIFLSATSCGNWETESWPTASKSAPAAERDLRKLDPHVRKQVNRDILRLEENPRPHGVEKMETKEKLYRVYAGPGKNYRVK